MLWAVLHIACADDTRLQQTVSFQEPAQTVGQILKKLSEQTSLTLFPVPPLDKEILIVDAKDLPLKTLMDALADALDAEWFEQPNGAWRLTRTAKKAMERRKQDDAELKANLPEGIRRATKELQARPWTRQQLEDELRTAQRYLQDWIAEPEARTAEARDTLFDQSLHLNPARRLALRALQQIPIQKLLDIPVGERRVFSDLRARYLEPLGFDVKPLLRQFAHEQSLLNVVWHDPQIGIDAAEKNHRQATGYPSLLTTFWNSLPDQQPVDAVNLRLYLEIVRTSPDSFIANAHVEDITTRRTYRGSNWSIVARGTWSPLPDGAWREQPVEWSEATRQLASVVSTHDAIFYREVDETSLAFRVDEARQRLLDPAITEPHALVTTDLLRSYARALSKPLVALPNEENLLEVASLCQAILSGRDRLAMYERLLQGYRWRERGGVLIAVPPLVSYAWSERFNRGGVSRLTKRVLQRGYLALEDRLEWAQAEAPTETVGEFWASWRGATAFRYTSPHTIARFLNRLSEQERKSLLSGAPISLYQMSPTLRNAVIHLVYYADISARVQSTDPEKSNLPHAAFPTGLPTESSLRVRVTETACYIPQRGDALQGRPVPLDTLLYVAERGVQDETQVSAVGLFGAERLYELELVMPDEKTVIRLGAISEFRPLHEKPARWRELPESIREQLTRLSQPAGSN
jgi:hypothetical protein